MAPVARAREAMHLYRWHVSDIPAQVKGLISQIEICKQRVQELAGLHLSGKNILDIGPGQKARQMTCFAVDNQVIGIDLDVISNNTLTSYAAMLHHNGPMRTAKTIGRKVLGLDRKFACELKKQLNLKELPQVDVREMDATKMAFEDGAFDFVYSFSVFEHLPDPGTVLDEVNRVLRPGGACYLSLHLYTSDNGCHDTRIFSGDRGDLPFWPHLRPSSESLVECNAYLNKLTLEEWKKLFRLHMPGVHFEYNRYNDEETVVLAGEISKARRTGDLQNFTDDELLTVELIGIWQKPLSSN